MISDRNIFICPLDWGLGHSSRCVPIIHELKKNNRVLIGVTELNSFFFEDYFPELQRIKVPGYTISYSKKLPLALKLALQWPRIKKTIQLENQILEQIIQNHKIDLVISDNRFGMYSKNTESIFITHQLKIKTPIFSSLANRINQKYIHQFNEVWVPDFEDKNSRLSGSLSDSEDIRIPVKYIQPQSALSISTKKTIENRSDYLILLSGVEPQRTLLENELMKIFRHTKKKIVLVRGTKQGEKILPENIQVIDFAFGNELKDLTVNAETVICRSGYSTLMDLFLLNKKKLILVPTPGQSEQEYLAGYWKENFQAETYDQNKLNQNFKIH